MGLVPYPPKFKIPTFLPYSGKGHAYQHVVHFKSEIGGMPDVDALKIRLFIGNLKGKTFDRYNQLSKNYRTTNCQKIIFLHGQFWKKSFYFTSKKKISL